MSLSKDIDYSYEDDPILGEVIRVAKVREAVKEANEKAIIDAILWARQWAEYCSDEEVLDKWRRKVALEIYDKGAIRHITTIEEIFGGVLL